MDIRMDEVIKAVQGKAAGALNEGAPVHRVSTDTRTIEKGDLFVSLPGARFDGHDYIKEALAKGATHVLYSNPKSLAGLTKDSVHFICVADTLKAYGDLAKFYRQKFKIPAVAITGSAGKTTLKELVAHVLGARFKVLKNRGTENNLVGVPKTIFGLEGSHEVAVLEMGTNRPGEIDRLSSIIAPQVGIVTSIGEAHLEGLKSREGVKEEKLCLVNNLERGGILILNGEDPMLSDVASGVHKIYRVGFSKETHDLSADNVWRHENGASFYVNGELFETSLLGRHNVLNCLYAILVAANLGLDISLIKKGIDSFRPVAGRLQFKNIEGIIFLDDSYNSNPDSFRASLDTLKDLKIRERRGVVCGDMLELGESGQRLHREIGAYLAKLLFDFVIAAGPLSEYLVDEAVKNGFDPKRIYHAKDSAEAGRICREMAVPGDRVLVKGSRGMQMEKVFECFITSSIP